MKKMLAAMLCVLILIAPASLAETFPAFPTPTPDMPDFQIPDFSAPESTEEPLPFQIPAPDSSAAAGSMRFNDGSNTVVLDFDPDPAFSIHENGYIQASFYGYSADDSLYELYMIYPDTVTAGDVVSSESSAAQGDPNPCIMLYITDRTDETYAVAAQDELGVYPEESHYSIQFSEVTVAGSFCTFAGTLEATLVALDDNYNSLYSMEGIAADFRFTMELGDSSGGFSPTPSQPEADLPRLPGLVTPPDAQKI